MLRRLLAILLCTSAFLAMAEQRDENEIVWINDSEPAMANAILKARETLNDFLALKASPPDGASDFKIKVRLEAGGEVEHFWVTPFRVTETGFEGTIANDGEVLKQIRYGQKISFDQSMVSDWGYVMDGKQIGSFTICVLFENMPKDEADYYRRNYGFQC
jgi:uncharacterized protein YegJ (DUF2314 family)